MSLPDDPWDLEYWTMSTCATCGMDGWNLTHARMAGIRVLVHVTDRLPDPVVDKAAAAGVGLPFFTDRGHTGFWPMVRNYLDSVKGDEHDGDNSTAV